MSQARNELIGHILACAKRAGIEPNDMIRFIVDYDNGVDAVEPCASVMSFCEYFLAAQREKDQERVPREPTPEMLLAACKMMGYDTFYEGLVVAARRYWYAMYAAAPQSSTDAPARLPNCEKCRTPSKCDRENRCCADD